MHRARRDEEREFLGWASKLRSRFVSGLASKPLGRFFPVWTQNRWRRLLLFGVKTGGDSFLVWASKPCRLRFVGCATKPTGGCDGVGHASRSSGWLHVEANRARVSYSGLNTGGGATAGGACSTIIEVALESSWRWTGRCDGLRRTLLPLALPFSFY
jgi:hypothetical protein